MSGHVSRLGNKVAGRPSSRRDAVGNLIYFVTAMADSRPAWYVVQVKPEHHAEFRRKLDASASMELTLYGEVLYSGWGSEPDAAAAEFLKQYS
jgi:hypothetical protein